MSDYILSACSTIDINCDLAAKRDIRVLNFHYFIDDVSHVDDLGVSVDYKSFYDAMRNGAMTRTSQPNPEEYEAYFTPFLEEGKDVLHLTLSSGISGAYNSANIAADMLKEKYPDRKIYVVDSCAASGGYGLLMVTLADLRDSGMGIDELHEYAEKNKLRLHHWFFTTDLTYLVRGGRVSKVSGFVGTVLNICPLLNVDNVGKLTPRYKIRSKKKVIQETFNRMVEHAENGKDYNGRVYITMSDCYDDARELADMIEAEFPNLKEKVQIFSIGTTIGAHTGPGTVALFFWGDERVD
ncbi:MAG: DegV family protein [Lachnospiraceae bacterium]|nr:DegV family protein [Lachnospiraceae bacterium]